MNPQKLSTSSCRLISGKTHVRIIFSYFNLQHTQIKLLRVLLVGQLKTTNLHIRYALNILSHLLILSMQFYQLEIKHSRILYTVVNFKFELCLGSQDIEGTGSTGCLLRTATYREKNQLKRENYVALRRAESVEQCLPFDIGHGDSKFGVFLLGFILDLVQCFSHFASIPLFWKVNAYPCICLIKC